MSLKYITIFVYIFLVNKVNAHHNHFGYSEPNQRRWSRHHGQCAGKIQSPISIHVSRAILLYMPAVDMIGYHNLLPYPLKIINNGHTVSIVIPKLSEKELEVDNFMPYIRGAKLSGEFELESIHFHWGDQNNRGAEHVINDMRYAMEMHIVHRNKKYVNMSEALNHADGVAVLAFFFNLDEDENENLTTICRHLHLIPESHNEVTMNVTFSLASLLIGVDIDKFYTYKGSLTTPPCSEAVTWILFTDPMPISETQINHFRQLYDEHDGALVDNYRHLQPLGKRRIFLRSINSRHTHIKNLKMKDLNYKKIDWFY